jgi:hypothetical protein
VILQLDADALWRIAREEGAAGLYKGFGPSLLLVIAPHPLNLVLTTTGSAPSSALACQTTQLTQLE